MVEHDLGSLDPDYRPKQCVPLEKMDWQLLKEQKQSLLAVMEQVERMELGYEVSQTSTSAERELDHLQGILHMIDGLQDYAVDHLGVPEDEVFNLSKEDVE